MRCRPKRRPTGLAIVVGFVVVSSLGCATPTTSVIRTIDAESLQKIADNPSESRLTVYRGDTIEVTLKKPSSSASIEIRQIRMVVVQADTKSINGTIISVLDENGWNAKTKSKEITIWIEDIERVSVFTTNLDAADVEYAEPFAWILAFIFWIAVLI